MVIVTVAEPLLLPQVADVAVTVADRFPVPDETLIVFTLEQPAASVIVTE